LLFAFLLNPNISVAFGKPQRSHHQLAAASYSSWRQREITMFLCGRYCRLLELTKRDIAAFCFSVIAAAGLYFAVLGKHSAHQENVIPFPLQGKTIYKGNKPMSTIIHMSLLAYFKCCLIGETLQGRTKVFKD
jgi:hypothetical protein